MKWKDKYFNYYVIFNNLLTKQTDLSCGPVFFVCPPPALDLM